MQIFLKKNIVKSETIYNLNKTITLEKQINDYHSKNISGSNLSGAS